MALAVVTKASGGLPICWVSAAPYALPITEATNGYGIAVTQVAANGLPATYITTSGAIVSPFTPTTWNSADLLNVTLTNGNLSAAPTNTSAGVRSVKNASSGKFYWEATMSGWSGSAAGPGFSLASTAFSSSGFTVTGTIGVTKAGGGQNGQIYVNGTGTGTGLGSMSAGAIIGIAFDLGAKLIWFRINPAGNWNNSGAANPATGVGGINTSTVSGVLFACFMPTNLLDACTANFGASAFNGAVPSGFTAGWG